MTNWKKHINRRKIRVFALIFLPAFLFVACEKKVERPGKTVALVDDEPLSEKHLQRLMDIHNIPETEKEKAIKVWIENEIYYKEAEEKGLLNSAKFETVTNENKRLIAKALLLDSFLSERKIDVTENEVKIYYDKHKDEFILREKAFVINKAEFDDLPSALEFRRLAIKGGWGFAEYKTGNKSRQNVLYRLSELPSLEAMHAVEYLQTGEISPVLQTRDKKYFLFVINKKLSANDYYPLSAVYNDAKTRAQMEKQVAAFNKYKKEIFDKHKIEVYGALNE